MAVHTSHSCRKSVAGGLPFTDQEAKSEVAPNVEKIGLDRD